MPEREKTARTGAATAIDFVRETALQAVAYGLPHTDIELYPSIFYGEQLERRIDTDPSFLVPSPDTTKLLLYFGCENVAGLKSAVFETLESYGMLTDNIRNTATLVEHAYEGKVRRTGEPEFAHVLRMVGQIAEFIHTHRLLIQEQSSTFRKFLARSYFDPDLIFNKPILDLLFIAALTHDFTEPGGKIKTVDQDGPKSANMPLGRVTTVEETELPQNLSSLLSRQEREPGIWIDRFEPIQTDGSSTWEIAESLRIKNIPEEHYHYFIEGLNGLNSADVDDIEVTSKLVSRILELAKRNPILSYALLFFPYIIKQFDRLDNGATYTFYFDRKNKTYKPIPFEKIYQKTQETLLAFPIVENLLADRIVTRVTNAFSRMFSINLLRIGRFYRQIISVMPSVWAKMTLLGYGPDEVWHARTSQSKLLRLPRLL